MSREKKPPRLWPRPASGDREAVWLILDGGKQISTRRPVSDAEGAERALSEYLAKKTLGEAREKYREASKVPMREILTNYVAMKRNEIKRPKEFASRMDALLVFWGTKTLNDIDRTTCKEYWESRSTRNQARRELEDLRAACNLAIADNVTRHAVIVTLPPKPKGRVRHLGRDDVAKLVWAAYRKREVQNNRFKGKIETKRRPTRHVARFILAALYTGSRSSRIWQASFVKEEGRPYIDLEEGVFYRSWEGERVAANKRAPAIRLPDRLLAHMRRWHKNGAEYLCEYQGKPSDPKRAFRNLANDVLGDGGADVVRHTMRHTAATWLMQAGTDIWEASGFLGMTKETLEQTYGHHHPDYQGGVNKAFTSGKAGRKPK